ncbi:hypothetical protein C8J57DRAFT_159330 [Mycena rebaudengoi]|nr:hypothetical protein C8J57DRAFT_159330 [Mycena rebaudengoi]
MAVVLIFLSLNTVSLVLGNILLPDTLNLAPRLGGNITSANLDPISRLAERAGVCTLPGGVQCPNALIYCCPPGNICQPAILHCCPSYGLQCNGQACCDPAMYAPHNNPHLSALTQFTALYAVRLFLLAAVSKGPHAAGPVAAPLATRAVEADVSYKPSRLQAIPPRRQLAL